MTKEEQTAQDLIGDDAVFDYDQLRSLIAEALYQAKREAYEEAALIVDGYDWDRVDPIANDIRALKNRRQRNGKIKCTGHSSSDSSSARSN